MKSPVSHVNVRVVGVRVMAMVGLPPPAMTVSSRCHTVSGCGARMVMRWTAGSMGDDRTRTYVRVWQSLEELRSPGGGPPALPAQRGLTGSSAERRVLVEREPDRAGRRPSRSDLLDRHAG